MLNDFSNSSATQLGLFDDVKPHANAEQLMQVLDRINGSALGHVWFAGQGISPAWQMKRDMLSPAWTTRWTDIPKAKLN